MQIPSDIVVCAQNHAAKPGYRFDPEHNDGDRVIAWVLRQTDYHEPPEPDDEITTMARTLFDTSESRPGAFDALPAQQRADWRRRAERLHAKGIRFHDQGEITNADPSTHP